MLATLEPHRLDPRMNRTLGALVSASAALALLTACGSSDGEQSDHEVSQAIPQSEAPEPEGSKDQQYISELVDQGIITDTMGQLALWSGPNYFEFSLARQFCEYALEHGVDEATEQLRVYGTGKLEVARTVYCPEAQ